MPEGPEIRREADAVAQAVVGCATAEIYFAFESLKPYESVLTGVVITAVETYGKAMLTRFANGLNIYSHNQLYGRWVIRNAYDFPDTNRQLRLAIHNAQKSALLYSASDIEVLPDADLGHHPFLSRIGPDLLDPSVTVEQVYARFVDDAFKRKRLTTLLLDQHFLAGTGNYLRSEILYYAQVHPSLRPIDCSDEQIRALAQGALMLTRRSYATAGITNDPDLAANLKDAGWPWRDRRWMVFSRDGQNCHRCGGVIVKDEIGGRRLYFCPQCQQI